MNKLINQYQNIPLSDIDITDQIKTNIVTYHDLPKYDNIDELLINDTCFLLYEFKRNYGHWCLISKHDNNIEFFDPYGKLPDYTLQLVNPNIKKELNEDYKYLTNLLLKTHYQTSYNPYDFQHLNKNIKTCGRWCILRAKTKDLPIQEFCKLFYGKDSDLIASFLTANKSQIK